MSRKNDLYLLSEQYAKVQEGDASHVNFEDPKSPIYVDPKTSQYPDPADSSEPRQQDDALEQSPTHEQKMLDLADKLASIAEEIRKEYNNAV